MWRRTEHVEAVAFAPVLPIGCPLGLNRRTCPLACRAPVSSDSSRPANLSMTITNTAVGTRSKFCQTTLIKRKEVRCYQMRLKKPVSGFY